MFEGTQKETIIENVINKEEILNFLSLNGCSLIKLNPQECESMILLLKNLSILSDENMTDNHLCLTGKLVSDFENDSFSVFDRYKTERDIAVMCTKGVYQLYLLLMGKIQLIESDGELYLTQEDANSFLGQAIICKDPIDHEVAVCKLLSLIETCGFIETVNSYQDNGTNSSSLYSICKTFDEKNGIIEYFPEHSIKWYRYDSLSCSPHNTIAEKKSDCLFFGKIVPEKFNPLLTFLSDRKNWTQGLFRISPSQDDLEKVCSIFDGSLNHDLSVVLAEYDSDVAAAVLKKYLGSLNVIPTSIGQSLIENFQHSDTITFLKPLKCSLKSLDDSKLAVLKETIHLLYDIANNGKVTEMNAENLGICFGPRLFTVEIDMLNVMSLKVVNIPGEIVSYMITHYDKIFLSL